MQLIVILLGTVSILTFLSGAITFFGSTKKYRTRSAWFFLAAIFATVWMTSISFFLTATNDQLDTIDWHIIWVFISAIILDVAFLGYTAWHQKFGKPMVIAFAILGLIISAAIAIWPHELYTNIVLSPTCNSVEMIISPLYFIYNGFFGAVVPAIVVSYLKRYFSSGKKRTGDLITVVGYGLSSTVILICNLIMPLMGHWGMIWLGPLSLAVTIISIYYTILRYHMLKLSSVCLKLFSHIVLLASIAIVYMVIFSLIFAALFKGSTPSIEVIMLNFIMILIFLSLMPAISALMNSTRSLINNPKVLGEKGKQ